MIEIFGWIGTGITVIAFGIVNIEKLERLFFPLNVIAALFLITYEVLISAWPVFALHLFILITYKVLSEKRNIQ